MKATLIIKDKTASFNFTESSDMTLEELKESLDKNEITAINCRARNYELNEENDFIDQRGKVLTFGFLFY